MPEGDLGPDNPSSDYKSKRTAYMRGWRERNALKHQEYVRSYLSRNAEKINEQRRSRYAKCKDPVLLRNAKWAKSNAEKVKVIRKSYRDRNRDSLAEKRAADQSRHSKTHAAWVLKNREKVRAYTRSYEASRLKTDIEFRLRKNLRCRVRGALKGGVKSHSIVEAVGCTVDELRTYLESQFKPGMSWENWSREGWHIDHKRPLAKFDLRDKAQLLEACHYTNLQPLWARENMSKGASYG